MKKDSLLISGLPTEKIYFNYLSAVVHWPITPGYIVGHFRDHFVLCRRKQDRAPDVVSISKKPQAIEWLLAAFLFFDTIPHNSLKFDRELWGMVSNWLGYFCVLDRKAQVVGKKPHLIKHLLCCAYDSACDSFQWYVATEKGMLSTIMPEAVTGYAGPPFLFPMIRGPPLLKF